VVRVNPRQVLTGRFEGAAGERLERHHGRRQRVLARVEDDSGAHHDDPRRVARCTLCFLLAAAGDVREDARAVTGILGNHLVAPIPVDAMADSLTKAVGRGRCASRAGVQGKGPDCSGPFVSMTTRRLLRVELPAQGAKPHQRPTEQHQRRAAVGD